MVYSIKQYSHYHRSVASRPSQCSLRLLRNQDPQAAALWALRDQQLHEVVMALDLHPLEATDPPGTHQGPTRDVPKWMCGRYVDMSDIHKDQLISKTGKLKINLMNSRPLE